MQREERQSSAVRSARMPRRLPCQLDSATPDGFLDCKFRLRFKPNPQVPLVVEGPVEAAIVKINSHGSSVTYDAPEGSILGLMIPQLGETSYPRIHSSVRSAISQMMKPSAIHEIGATHLSTQVPVGRGC